MCLSPSIIVLLQLLSWKKNPWQSGLPTETSENFPPENSIPADKWESQTASNLLKQLCNYVI